MTYREPPGRIRSASSPPTRKSWNSDIEAGVAYTPFKHQVEKKRPWRTLTGRQQFYIDHPWFLELGERSRCTRTPADDGKYPLFWNTPHGRWSIHSTWRDHRYLLRLQRGMPIVYMHPDDAAPARHCVTTTGSASSTRSASASARLQILPGEKPGRVTMYHGWEKFLGFQQGGWQSLTYIKIKPTQLVGKYGHVNFRLNYWGPTGNNRDIKVEIENTRARRRSAAPPGQRHRGRSCRNINTRMVMDLNKCLGCQTCTIACKKQWTDRDGMGYMYWNNVETRPGQGYPRQWDQLGGGFEGRPAHSQRHAPSTGRLRAPWEYNYDERLFEGKMQPVMPRRNPSPGRTGTRTWAP